MSSTVSEGSQTFHIAPRSPLMLGIDWWLASSWLLIAKNLVTSRSISVLNAAKFDSGSFVKLGRFKFFHQAMTLVRMI